MISGLVEKPKQLFMKDIREKIINKINKTIEVHRKNDAPTVGSGVLGRLLEEESLPDDAVVDFIINLLFAGSETTTKTMLFAVYFLTQCPQAMKQLLVTGRRDRAKPLPFKMDSSGPWGFTGANEGNPRISSKFVAPCYYMNKLEEKFPFQSQKTKFFASKHWLYH
ncbi:cytochrome P450 90B2 [Arachis duranensis]|uniref:Cytochrome P450 90B2 n=1 Tax=Arachis duranensis TaxID=130453 RepID=A0A9C6WDY1_ARADU|nr:cytochrome P450 90B2 [Arachis duranensis]